MSQPLEATHTQDRIQTIDILRGLALIGITIINFTVDNRRITPADGWSGAADQLAYWPIKFFLDDKFIAIYCFLFGLGFAIQLQRAEAKNSPFLSVYIRRLLVLYLIGAAHEILTQESILHDYAMVGILLLFLHWLPQKVLPALALLCVLVPWTWNLIEEKNIEWTVIGKSEALIDTTALDACVGVYERERQPGRYNVITREGRKVFSLGRSGRVRLLPKSEFEFAVAGAGDTFSFVKDSAGLVTKLVIHPVNASPVTGVRIPKAIVQAEEEMKLQIGRNGIRAASTYKDFVMKSVEEFRLQIKNWSWVNFFLGFHIYTILPLFLMGLYFGRRKIFLDVSGQAQFLRRVFKWGLLFGATGVAINLGFEGWNFINHIEWNAYSILTKSVMQLFWNGGVMLMALGYVSGFTLLLEQADWKKRLSIISHIGRMGLTNYILQSVFYVLIFDEFSLGLTGKIGPMWRLILALPCILVITIISRWWFNRFSIGPAEWLWRSLTYWKIQPVTQPSKKVDYTSPLR